MTIPGIAGKLIFNQDFSTITAPDPTIWSSSWFGSGKMNNVTTDPKNVSIVNGQLVLTLASATSGALVNTNPSDGIKKGFQFTYGYVEASITFPSLNGQLVNWPAFWTDGQSWPTTGEFDIAEVLGGHMTTNYHYGTPANPQTSNSGQVPGDWTGKHRYGMLWTPNLQAVYFDGKLVYVRQGLSIVSSPQYLILNHGASGTANVGANMLVDYVKVWQ